MRAVSTRRCLTLTDRVGVPVATGIRACRVGDLAYIQAADDYSEVHLVSGEVVLAHERLRAWEKRLPNSFLRIHRSTIANLEMVAGLVQSDGVWQVHLPDLEEELPVSRRLVPSAKNHLRSLGPSEKP